MLRSRETPFVALYWDLQGSGDARGLAETLLSSVEDSEAFCRATDLGVEDLESLPVAEMLATLVRRTVRSGWRLLLLVDEAEELLVVGRTDPGVLARLRRVISRGPDVRTVITATRLLARIDEDVPMPTSPFLQGFIPPVYLTPLSPDEGRTLARPRGLRGRGRGARPRADRGATRFSSSCSPAGSSRAGTWRRRSTSSPRTR